MYWANVCKSHEVVHFRNVARHSRRFSVWNRWTWEQHFSRISEAFRRLLEVKALVNLDHISKPLQTWFCWLRVKPKPLTLMKSLKFRKQNPDLAAWLTTWDHSWVFLLWRPSGFVATGNRFFVETGTWDLGKWLATYWNIRGQILLGPTKKLRIQYDLTMFDLYFRGLRFEHLWMPHSYA